MTVESVVDEKSTAHILTAKWFSIDFFPTVSLYIGAVIHTAVRVWLFISAGVFGISCAIHILVAVVVRTEKKSNETLPYLELYRLFFFSCACCATFFPFKSIHTIFSNIVALHLPLLCSVVSENTSAFNVAAWDVVELNFALCRFEPFQMMMMMPNHRRTPPISMTTREEIIKSNER